MEEKNHAEEAEDFLFENMGAFYNRNARKFKDFEEKLGVDIWFLEHFRMHFKLRNQRLKTKGREASANSKHLKGKAGLYREMSTILQSGWAKPRSNPKNILFVNSRFVREDGKFRFNSEETKSWTLVMNRELGTVMDDGFRKQWSNTMNTDAIIFRYFLSFRWIVDGPSFYWKLQKTLKKLTVKSRFDESILLGLKAAVPSFMLYWVRFNSMQMFFNRMNCENILMWDENSPQQKVIQYAARSKGIQVGAIQHGSIYKHHPAYAYAQYDFPPLLPDVTFVWGSKFRDVLTGLNGYRPESIVITGKVKEQIELVDSNQPGNFWLYASQPLRNGALREQILIDVCKAANKGFEIVIRPHPTEQFDGYFNEISSRAGLNNIRIERHPSLLQHLSACKGLIVTSSTVGFEFLEFNKPMIVMDYLEQDLMHWIKNDLGTKVINLEELEAALKKGQFVASDSRKDIIESLFYKNDDRALNRILQHFN